MKTIQRNWYLNQLKAAQGSSMVKIITGIRRCGKSYLLFKLFYAYLISEGVDERHILRIALDDLANLELRNPLKLLEKIKNAVIDEERYYVMLDEIQMVDHFVEVLNSLLHIENIDLYVTGSNSRFLSSDIATEFRGRGDEIHLYPLSFSEFMSAKEGLNPTEGWQEYVRFGGLPQVVELPDPQKKTLYLSNLYSTVYTRDIMERYKIQKSLEFDELLEIVASSIGAPLNPRRLSNTFQSSGRSNLSPETVSRFLGYARESFLVEKALRYDVKGNRYINNLSKFYFSDTGLRNSILNFRQMEESHLMENVVYNDLKIRGFSVDVGNVEVFSPERKTLEVDFVAQRGSACYYIQSALSIPDKEKMRQETASFQGIRDAFKKVVIVRDRFLPWHTSEGYLVLSLYDFLLNPASLNS